MLSLPEKDILDKAAEGENQDQNKPLPPLVTVASLTSPAPNDPHTCEPAKHDLERELNAIRVTDSVFEGMTRGERTRVIHWLMERFVINA